MNQIKLLLYTTKQQPYLVYHREYCALSPTEYIEYGYETRWEDKSMLEDVLNGKIVAECDFEVEEMERVCVGIFKYCYRTKTLDEYDLMYKTQLNGERMKEYLQGNGYANHKGYAIHIKNLHIFDEPRDLDFYSSNYFYFKEVEKAPQNMMKVWEDRENPRILISIKPEWLCKILNRIKDVEVRKVVLKEMLK